MLGGKDKICVNARAVTGPLTGVQRYLRELLAHISSDSLRLLEPPSYFRHGMRGHLWEQVYLPVLAKDSILWSPCNSGPMYRRRQVVTIHDVSPLDHPEWSGTRFARWYNVMIPGLARSARRVITDSAYTKLRLVKATGISDEKVAVIPLGVSERFGPKSEDEIAHVRVKYGLASKPYLLSLGSLEVRKNLHALLMAWSGLSSRIESEVTLVLAGERGASRVFGKRNLSLPGAPNVRFTGRVEESDLPALYSGALAFVYVSRYEGFGLPPLEAMACGAPVIASNTTSLPEVVGDAALQVDPADTKAIADAMLGLISDPDLRASLRKKGLERATQFSWERTARSTLRVLQEASES